MNIVYKQLKYYNFLRLIFIEKYLFLLLLLLLLLYSIKHKNEIKLIL